MNLRAFHGRFAGLVSLGKTVGILLIVINLAAAFVLERYRIARTAIEVEQLEQEVTQLHKKKAHLQSKVSNLESLDHIGSLALDKYSLKLPHPNQIVWLAVLDVSREDGPSTVSRTIGRLAFLYTGLHIPSVAPSSASADEGVAR
jgi:cell division protein FtsL